ncbi:MAG: TVP38/TMEM64 family protein [Candidatus Altiarchaeota archaeon]
MVVHKALTKKHRLEHANLLVVLFLLVAGYYLSSPLRVFFTDHEAIKATVASYGSLGPIVLIVFHIVQTIIFFLPGPFISIAGGYLFGVWWGTIYNIIGSTIGSMSLFFIARRVGQHAFKKWMDEREYMHIEASIDKRGLWTIFFARFIPVFPNDVVTIAAGVSPIKTRDFFIVSFIGYIPTLYIENLFGDQLSRGITAETIVLSALLVLLGVIYLARNKIKILVLKEVAAIEKEMHFVEGKIEKALHMEHKKGEIKSK